VLGVSQMEESKVENEKKVRNVQRKKKTIHCAVSKDWGLNKRQSGPVSLTWFYIYTNVGLCMYSKGLNCIQGEETQIAFYNTAYQVFHAFQTTIW